MSNSQRPERVGQEIQAAVADMLTRGQLHDPRIGYITLTGVKVSPDLRTARIYYSLIGTAEQVKTTQEGLDAAKGFVRREITQRLRLRFSPEVFFSYDGSLAEGDKIERLLKEVRDKEGW